MDFNAENQTQGESRIELQTNLVSLSISLLIILIDSFFQTLKCPKIVKNAWQFPKNHGFVKQSKTQRYVFHYYIGQRKALNSEYWAAATGEVQLNIC